MQGYGTGKHLAFEVTALAHEIRHFIAVGDAFYILFDNRALIEVGGNVMGGGTDDFYATLLGLVVGLCADKGRQE